ncbi:glycosyltransferase [Kitasatospora purpeofusca]|uniref:D-inositol 3-phosphate glycosyltransferase n=1 Tax=Kitasatospora purpeofusca TaxID=67352 RepID=A0ABZ1U3Y9_9ACTN|nr:glycosyltransferase [Kitasatospora purpeofusca]
MRICFVVKFPPTQGGVAVRAALLARALVRRGHEVHVVTNAFEVADTYRIAGAAAATSVTVVPLTPPTTAMRHIPQTDATVSRLAGAAARVIRAHDCEVVYSNYLEPCGVAAHLASLWTGVPHVLRSAGTDRNRLMNHGDLQTTYKEALLGAAAIVAAPGPLPGLGVDRSRFTGAVQPVVPTELFHPGAAPLDLAALAAGAAAGGTDLPDPARLGDGTPVIGYYGKANARTGLRHLVEAMALMTGPRPYVAALVGGSVPAELRARIDALGLTDRFWLLPFVPVEHVPGYLRACTAVALLEHDFPIRQHIPTKLRECFATGTAAIATRELIRKESTGDRAEHGRNLYVVADPTDHAGLAGLLGRVCADPAGAARVGAAGQDLLDGETDLDAWADRYAGIFQDAARRGGRSTDPAADGPAPEELRLLLPLTAELLGAGFDEEYTRFAQEERTRSAAALRHPSAARALVTTAAAFARHVQEHGPALRPGIPAVLWRIQAAAAWLGLDLGHHLGTPYLPPPAPRDGGAPAPGPVRSGQLRLLRLDAAELAAAVSVEGLPRVREAVDTWLAAPGGTPDGEDGLCLLLQRLPNLETRVYRIGRAVEGCLRLADGSTDAATVADRLGARPEAVARLLAELAERGLVQLDAAPSPVPPADPDVLL